MPTSPQDLPDSGSQAPLEWPEIDTIIGQTSNLVRQMAKDVLARIRQLADREALS